MAKPQKWQHFLPQMYIRGFLDPTEVAKGQHVLWSRYSGEIEARGRMLDVGKVLAEAGK